MNFIHKGYFFFFFFLEEEGGANVSVYGQCPYVSRSPTQPHLLSFFLGRERVIFYSSRVNR